MSFVRIGIHPNLSGFVIWPGSSQPGQHTTVLTRHWHALPRDRENSSSAVIPTRTAGPSLGNRKDTRAHAPGAHEHPLSKSPVTCALCPTPAVFATSDEMHRVWSPPREHPQSCCNFPCPACRNTATTPGSHVLGVGTIYPANWLSAPPNHTSPNQFQGAVPDVANTDPGHGREMIVELKFINPGPTRYDSSAMWQQAYVPL